MQLTALYHIFLQKEFL